MSDLPPNPDPTPPTAAERTAILTEAVREQVARGGVVERQTADEAVVVVGKPVNHFVHLFLAILTGGIWLAVWIFFALTQGPKRRSIRVDEQGQVQIGPIGS